MQNLCWSKIKENDFGIWKKNKRSYYLTNSDRIKNYQKSCKEQRNNYDEEKKRTDFTFKMICI